MCYRPISIRECSVLDCRVVKGSEILSLTAPLVPLYIAVSHISYDANPQLLSVSGTSKGRLGTDSFPLKDELVANREETDTTLECTIRNRESSYIVHSSNWIEANSVPFAAVCLGPRPGDHADAGGRSAHASTCIQGQPPPQAPPTSR